MNNIEFIREKFREGEYAVSDHAITEARKDGIEPNTMKKLEWAAIMMLLKKRTCPECSGEMIPKLINLLYKKEHCDLQVEVIGIPANVCTKCFYRIIPGKVAKYIDSLVDPIFESHINQKEMILPAPHIDIQFPALERETYCCA